MAATRFVDVESDIFEGTLTKLKGFLYDAISLSSLLPGEVLMDWRSDRIT
jgi:hypothetical protein